MTVTESNQISTPPDLARTFDIHPGARLKRAIKGAGIITVRPLPDQGQLARPLMGPARHPLKPGADTIGDLVRKRAQDDQLANSLHLHVNATVNEAGNLSKPT